MLWEALYKNYLVFCDMIVKLFGILDLLGAISLILLRWDIGGNIGLVLGALLGIKALVFFYNWASIVDMVSVLFLILACFGFYFSFSWIFAFWLLQKGFFSLVG